MVMAREVIFLLVINECRTIFNRISFATVWRLFYGIDVRVSKLSN
jgi:hypothetical protein